MLSRFFATLIIVLLLCFRVSKLITHSQSNSLKEKASDFVLVIIFAWLFYYVLTVAN
jgi:Na+-driven multidrug efflux pump